MQEATQQPPQASQPPEKAAATVRPEAQRRRPPIRVACDCCGPAEDKS